MFKTRLISGIVLVLVAMLLIIPNADVLLVGTLIISLIGMYELYRVFKVEKSVLAMPGYLVAILFYVNCKFQVLSNDMLLYMTFLILLLFIYVFAYPKFDAKQVMATFFGFFYVAVMLSFVPQIRYMEHGVYLTFLIFICSWGCDTSAYCVGKLIGKHKMSPILSPKKSVEGAVGGVIGAGLLSFIYCMVFSRQMNLVTDQIIFIVVASMIAALISMVGDLAASAIKRNYDIKDYGTLIPGHGGILDRFDSMIITSPIIYFALSIFANGIGYYFTF